jgi:hypothetical protein
MPKASTGAVGAAGAGARPGAAIAAGAAGGAAAEFLRGGGAGAGSGVGARAGVDNRAAGRAEARADRQADRVANRPERIENRQQRSENRVQRRDEVRNQVQENHPRLDFWSDHPGWASWRISRPYRWATWGALTGWLGAGWSEPTAYAYGDNVYYQDESVYYGDQAVASTEAYAQQAEQIVASAPEVAPDKAEWLSLGVFALTPDGQASGPDPSLYLQLAISKEGVIAGTFNNSATQQTQTIEGMVDKKSQRAAWSAAGKNRPIMETGIVNLTADSAPALVHFADGSTQQLLLVRLEEPAAKP